MQLIKEFKQMSTNVKELRQMPSDDELLDLYGLFKQVTIGDNNSAEPAVTNMRCTAKWNAWAKFRGMYTEKAMQAYVQKVQQLMMKYND